MKKRPIIGITMGDPKGIGPEIIQKALQKASIRKLCRPVVFGEATYFDWKKSRRLTPCQCGKLSGFSIEQAAHACLEGYVDAMVTAPISKAHLRAGGYTYPGHTEFLADLAGVPVQDVRMMMAGPQLKVVLVTIHEPIAKVASLLTQRNIFETIRITHQSLNNRWGLKKPRIAVAALNPHAGESGMFGNEETKVIVPAVAKARRQGWKVLGPYSPDTVFYRAIQGEFDVVIAMYHDQGLIPLKILDFERAVNITLGLPFIRTSVDHGTAFDIAGKGVANPSSLIAAIETAVELANNERRKVPLRSE